MNESSPHRRRVWPLVFLLAASGCATWHPPDLTAEVAALDTRLTQLQKEVQGGALQAGPAGSKPSQGMAAATDVAALDARINTLETEISALRQRLDDSAARIESLAQDLVATREMALRAQPPKTAPTQPPVGDGEPSAPSEGDEAGGAPSGSAAAATTVEDTFSAAYADYAKGNYALALAGFQEFLHRYPGSELADNAQFWIAESYYAQGDFTTAAERYDQVVKNYPKGDRVPAALLKRGFCLIEMNKAADGVVLLQHLIQSYPTSDEAALAKQKLAGLGVKP
ncbi:MAG TPA: tol-pal system protein YbgF [Candidatus Polarisedimenticolia bacterium]|nr:tol-pal system protein YbgF [Candidatus Polarisedimenticolia bacterium]